MNESTLKLSRLGIAVAFACGRRQPFTHGPTIQGLLLCMLTTARNWEQMEEIREKHGIKSEPAPFHSTVMSHLAGVNEIRVAAQRVEMRRQLDQKAKIANIERRRAAFRPHVSRRVEHERRQRLHNENTAGEEGPVLTGSGDDR